MECLMDHIVLNVNDVEKMIAFYSSVLKFAPERLPEYRRGEVPFPSLRLNPDTIIDLFPKEMWLKEARTGDSAENLNHFCIVLDKRTWDVLRQRLHSNGIDVEEGPVLRWGSHGTGISVYFRDPENNLIEARHYSGVDSPEKCLLGS